MTSLNRSMCVSALAGLCLAAVSPAMGQNAGQAVFSNISITALNPAGSGVGSINSAVIKERYWNDAPTAVGTYINNYPTSITLGESGVQSLTGYADRDEWYFSSDGTSPYQFQSGDYFSASFDLTLSGGIPGLDLEGGLVFHNPNTDLGYGGDLQILAVGQGGNAGVEYQAGGPSFFLFGNNGTYPNGSTISIGLTYTIDPNTGQNAFEYSLNGVYANAGTGGTDFYDITPVNNPFGAGNILGGYFQIQTVIVPEPSTLALLGLGFLPLIRLLRRRA